MLLLCLCGCLVVQLHFFSLICIFFSFSLERVHTLTQVLLHKFDVLFFISFTRFFVFLFRLFYGVIMRFNFFAFLSVGFFSPIFTIPPSFAIKSIKYTHTKVLHTRQETCFLLMLCDTNKKDDHLQMLKKNVSIYLESIRHDEY